MIFVKSMLSSTQPPIPVNGIFLLSALRWEYTPQIKDFLFYGISFLKYYIQMCIHVNLNISLILYCKNVNTRYKDTHMSISIFTYPNELYIHLLWYIRIICMSMYLLLSDRPVRTPPGLVRPGGGRGQARGTPRRWPPARSSCVPWTRRGRPPVPGGRRREGGRFLWSLNLGIVTMI